MTVGDPATNYFYVLRTVNCAGTGRPTPTRWRSSTSACRPERREQAGHRRACAERHPHE